MPTMPPVVGLYLDEAEASLQAAGVLNLLTLGYFGIWPITAQWQNSAARPSTVLAQTPASGATIAANAPVTLTVASYPFGVSYP